ncbi:MAG TPA: hypothetical protein VLV83_13060 [Acidobacteriota bacterium]|nr:hypothetical protein [Acidobacteriota bacterium]
MNDEFVAAGAIEILDPDGLPLEVALSGLPDGQSLGGFEVPASGVFNLRSEGLGEEVIVGSVRVRSDRHLVGVVTFGGETGLAGVGASEFFEQRPVRHPACASQASSVISFKLSVAGLESGFEFLLLRSGVSRPFQYFRRTGKAEAHRKVVSRSAVRWRHQKEAKAPMK